MIELVHDEINLIVGNCIETTALGDVLPHQPRSTLPSSVYLDLRSTSETIATSV